MGSSSPYGGQDWGSGEDLQAIGHIAMSLVDMKGVVKSLKVTGSGILGVRGVGEVLDLAMETENNKNA